MAKERGNDKGAGGEDYEFVPADFDEDAFIHREMVSFRTTSILFGWGIVAALVSWGLFHAVEGDNVGWLLGLLVFAVFGVSLRWIYPRLNADIKHFGRREWLGTAFLFFFTWLAFFIIAVNPPVSDYAAPRVDVHASPPVQQAGGDVAIEAFFEDNDRVADHGLTVTGPDGPVPVQAEDLGRGHHRFTATGLPAGIYTVDARASDDRGHEENATIRFAVVETVLTVEFPDGTTLDGPGDRVLVQVGGGLPVCTKALRNRGETCVREVHLDLGAGQRVVLEHDEQVGGWLAYPNHAGWTQGRVTFDAVAEVMDVYAGNTRVEGGRLVDGPHTINVTAVTGDYVPKVLNDPSAPARNVPGVGPIVLAAAMLAAVAIVRGRKGPA